MYDCTRQRTVRGAGALAAPSAGGPLGRAPVHTGAHRRAGASGGRYADSAGASHESSVRLGVRADL